MRQIEARLQEIERVAKLSSSGDFVGWLKGLQGLPEGEYWQRVLAEIGPFLPEGETTEQYVARARARRAEAGEVLSLFAHGGEVMHGPA